MNLFGKKKGKELLYGSVVLYVKDTGTDLYLDEECTKVANGKYAYELFMKGILKLAADDGGLYYLVPESGWYISEDSWGITANSVTYGKR